MVFGFKPITFGTSPITTRPGLPPYVSYFVNFVFFVHSKFVVEFSVQKIIATTGYLDGAVKEKDSIFKSTSASSDLLLDLLALFLSLSLSLSSLPPSLSNNVCCLPLTQSQTKARLLLFDKIRPNFKLNFYFEKPVSRYNKFRRRRRRMLAYDAYSANIH